METCKTFKTFIFKLIIGCKYTCKTRSSHRGCSIENALLKISKIHRNLQALSQQLCWEENSPQLFSCEFRKNFNNTIFKNTGRLLLENVVLKSIRQTFNHHGRCIISDPVLKKIAHEISFSWVCKINLQSSVISRHRINH